MIIRKLADCVIKAARQYPSVTLFGPRQSGKTTLARELFPDYAYANLEYLETRRMAANDPEAFFRRFKPPVIIDEVQRVPELASQVQVMIDADRRRPGRFVLTGSHQPLLAEAVSQSLAGRTSLLTLYPPSLDELGDSGKKLSTDELIWRGTMPELYVTDIDPHDYYRNYFQTYVERDVRKIVNVKDVALFERFVRLLAGRTGQLVNYAGMSGEVGVSATTISNWVSVLEASFIVFRLQPFFTNRSKRLVKSPKLYFTEPGLAAYLLHLETPDQVARDPLRGALFENLVVMEAVKSRTNCGKEPNSHFLRTESGFEIDLVSECGRELEIAEIKSAMTFHDDFAKNVRTFMRDDGRVRSARVIYDGADYDLSDGVLARNLRSAFHSCDKGGGA